MAKRNYIRDAHAVGKTYTQIAKELNLSPRTVSSYSRGLTSPEPGRYEDLRNVYRRATYSAMRKSGYSSRQATESRRELPADIVYRGDWFESVTNVIDRNWNAKHRNPKDPKHLTRAYLRRCIQKGIDRGLSREEIEDKYW